MYSLGRYTVAVGVRILFFEVYRLKTLPKSVQQSLLHVDLYVVSNIAWMSI